MKGARGGFTLLELMVCVAIILVLCALFLPVLSRCREAAGRVRCQSQIRQLGLALLGYASVHDDFLPHEDNGDTQPPFSCGWYEVLDATLGDRRCLQCGSLSVDPTWRSYKMNSLLEEGGMDFRNLGSIEDPSRTVLAFDGRVDNPGVRRLPKGTWDLAAPRHGEGTVCLFCDGHVAWISSRFDTAGWADPGSLVWRP